MHIAPNGKMYIGQTVHGNSPNLRWNDGKGYIGCTHFYHAIQKYGWDNFEHIICYDNLTAEEANLYEEWLIYLGNTTNPKYGYNIRYGGDNKRKSDSIKFIEKFEQMKKYVMSHRGKVKNPKSMGQKRQYHLGPTCTINKIVVCIETVQLYYTMSDASRQTGFKVGHIRQCCSDFKYSIDGYHWAYAYTINDFESVKDFIINIPIADRYDLISPFFICVDCGEQFARNGTHDTRTIRCPECREIYVKNYDAQKHRRYYHQQEYREQKTK